MSSALRAPQSAQAFAANLDWLGLQFKLGQSSFIAFNYSAMLLAAAQALPADQADGLRGMALAAMLFAISTARIEAQQCADLSARADRAQQFIQILGASHSLDLSEPERKQAAFVALGMERRTWPSRKILDDTDFLCANGMAAASAALANGNIQEVNAVEGQIGRQFSYSVPQDFEYERLPDEEWWVEAQAIRVAMPKLLMDLARVENIPGAERFPTN